MAKRTKAFERTIEESLFEAWKTQRRTEDVQELIEITGKSHPIIYRALNFGHIKDESLTDTISKFYLDRVKKQKQFAKEIFNELK